MTKSKLIIIFLVVTFFSLLFYGIFSAKNKVYLNIVCLENQDSLNTVDLNSKITYFVGFHKNIKTIELTYFNYEGYSKHIIKKPMVVKDGAVILLSDTLKLLLNNFQKYPFLQYVGNNLLKSFDEFKKSDGNMQILVLVGSLPKGYTKARVEELIQRLTKLDNTNKKMEILYMMTCKSQQEEMLYNYFQTNYGNQLTDKRIGVK